MYITTAVALYSSTLIENYKAAFFFFSAQQQNILVVRRRHCKLNLMVKLFMRKCLLSEAAYLCHTWPNHLFMNRTVQPVWCFLLLLLSSSVENWRLFPPRFVCELWVKCEQWSIARYQIGVRAIFSIVLSLWCWRCSCVHVSATVFTCRQTVTSVIAALYHYEKKQIL